MSVWCVSLMAVMGRLAQETQGDSNIEKMLQNAAGALRQVRDLVAQRANSMNGGILAKAAAFWTASAYQEQMKVASEWLQKAIQALSLSVSVQTKTEVVKVLDKVELLPRMDAKLDVMNDKMDQVLVLCFAFVVMRLIGGFDNSDPYLSRSHLSVHVHIYIYIYIYIYIHIL